MTELQPGTRVRTAAVLSGDRWLRQQNKQRQAATDGTIRVIHTPEKGEPWYEVDHGPTHTAKYDAHELTVIRERATEAAAPTPEQTRLDVLERRVNRLALEALPALLRRIEQLEQSPRRRRIRAWQALERACREQMPADVIGALRTLQELPDDESPPDSAQRELLADLRDTLTAGERGDFPLLEIADARARESSLHQELRRRLSVTRIGLLCDWLEQAGDELGQSTLAELLHDLLPAPNDDEICFCRKRPCQCDDEPDSERACREAGCPTCTCERDGLGLLERVDPSCPAGCRVGLAQPVQDKPA